MFKMNQFESTLCSDYGHWTNKNDVNVQTISGMLHQLMDARG